MIILSGIVRFVIPECEEENSFSKKFLKWYLQFQILFAEERFKLILCWIFS